MNETMPGTIVDVAAWLAAEGAPGKQEREVPWVNLRAEASPREEGSRPQNDSPWEKESRGETNDAPEFSAADLPVHQLPAAASVAHAISLADHAGEPASAPPEISQIGQEAQAAESWSVLREIDSEGRRQRNIYRNRTVAMLRRYMRYAMETGRLPSLLGREFFRTQITRYQVTTFEDRVIFVHDMDRCLDRLDDFSREVLARVILQEYEHGEAARLMGCTRMTVHRRLVEALDLLSYILVEVGLLDAVPGEQRKSCQGGVEADFPVSDWDQGK